MSIQIFNPTGKVASVERIREQKLDVLDGKKAGFIFNQHASAGAFWQALEQAVEKQFAPASLKRVYKDNTWAPAPQAKVEDLARDADYVLVGVGA